MKCSGDKPCRACTKHNWECTFGHSGRRRFSEASVNAPLASRANLADRFLAKSSIYWTKSEDTRSN